MDNIKNMIINKIQDKKQEVIKQYDNKINQINQIKLENNPANICYLLAKTYGNTMEQGEIEIKYLQNVLTNNFFKTAKVKDRVNYIVFFNNEFEVMFSKSLYYEIKIKFKNIEYEPYCSSISPTVIKLADLIEIYLNHKTFKNFKILSEYNCRRRKKNFINKILGYIATYRRCNINLLNDIRQKQKKDKIKKIEYEKELKLYNSRQKYVKDFINGLTDLKLFIDNGWHVNLYGIKDENSCINYK